MFTAKNPSTYQQISAWNSSYLDQMTLLQHEQNYSLPCFSSIRTADVAFPRYYPSNFCLPNASQLDAVGGVLKQVPPYSPPGIDFMDKAIPVSCAQKRFVIFDQPSNQWRMFFSTSYGPQSQILAPEIPAITPRVCEEVTAQVNPQFSMEPNVFEEHWDENHLTDSEGEMREDTEEINALLYSDSDESDDEGDSNEVTSNKDNLQMVPTKAVSSDKSPKRQKLLDGKYKKPSLSISRSTVKQPILQSCEGDIEASCRGNYNSYHNTSSCKIEKKAKIHRALKTLESIIPGLVTNDPLSVIDKAITYLKSMKSEAEALGLNYSGSQFANSS